MINWMWMALVIMVVVFGMGDTIAHVIRGDIHNFWDGVKFFGQGAATGFALGIAWQYAPLIPYIGRELQTVMTWYAYGQVGAGIFGTTVGVFNGGWKGIGNGVKTFLGNFYMDENSWLRGPVQGFLRHTWEIPQSFIGQVYTQLRNTFRQVDRIDYFGGATFAIKENSDKWNGVTLGDYINVNISDEIAGRFNDKVENDPFYMHEYGHTIDSCIFGLFYLFAIGIPSIISAAKASQIAGEPRGVSSHDFFWTEMRANRRAKKYFRKYSGIEWHSPYRGHTIETFYPRKRNF